MKKIININFHSRVVPIEETAYEMLQQYVESLRRYFANEEGRDEIISDIENRFAELFSDRLKKGSTCITDEDVNAIIASMGRPEEFEEEEKLGNSYSAGNGGNQQQQGAQQQTQQQSQEQGSTYGAGPRRLYRSENDKILGGVCGGLANYLQIDPAIVRIIFFLLIFGAAVGVFLYIILWIILPTRSLPSAARKRLYRNPDDKVIAGVASGLSAYFHIDTWIPRLIFALPLVIGTTTSIIRHAWWFHYNGPIVLTGGLGGTLFITYIILWIVLPEAVTASEKLEMRGEKVDLESIKNTIKTDLENFNKRAREMGSEMKDSFQKAGDQVKQRTKNFTAEAYPAARRTGTGIGHAIGVIFKAFFLFIAGCICFALITALGALAFRGDGVLHFKDFIFEGFWQNFLAWVSLVLLLVLPVIALLTWLIRRLTGIRSTRHYLGAVFVTLWVIGLFTFIGLVAMVANNFRSRQHVEGEFAMTQPSRGKLIVRATEVTNRYYDSDSWDDFGWARNWRHSGPFYDVSEDSVRLNTIKVNVVKSTDSFYHTEILRFSLGHDASSARNLAEQIRFALQQSDSVLFLPNSFVINREQRFRNQKVLVILAVPVGKHVFISDNIAYYHWFNIDVHKSHINWNEHWDDDWGNGWDDNWDNGYHWNVNTEYVMTDNGLVRLDNGSRMDRRKKGRENNRDGNNDNSDEENDRDRPNDGNNDRPDARPSPEKGYRYQPPAEPSHRTAPSETTPKTNPSRPQPAKPGRPADSSKTQASLQTPKPQSRPHELLLISALAGA